MTTDRISNFHMYTNTCAPAVADSALHLAAYNGRTAKFRSLLAANPAAIYTRTSDIHNTTPFTVALSRGHTAIAAICLQQIEPDLATLEAHFARIGGPIYASHFWLRSQVMIVTDPEDVQFARSESVGLLADPAEMQNPANGSVRRGLILLLRPQTGSPQPEVLWLTARQLGDDRQLARIVARCCQRDGWLDILQPDYWGRNCFRIAARGNLPEFWQRMLASFGQPVLSRRELASSFRLLAEHQPAAGRVQHFDGLCRSVGGFEAADLFAAADLAAESRQTYEVLQDALREFNGDSVLLDYLVELAARRRLQTGTDATLAEAISRVIQLPSHGCDQEQYGLLDWAFQHLDETLSWHCLRYEPDLFAKLGKFECDLIWSMLSRSPLKRFETNLETLIEKQIFAAGRTDILAQLFRELCKADFGKTARLVWSRMPAELREDFDQYEVLLLEELMSGHWDTVRCLLAVLPSAVRLPLAADALARDADRPQRFPDDVWTQLLPGNPDEWNVEHVGQFLCAALEKRQMDAYERVWQLVRLTFDLKNACDYGQVSILFHCIYNTLAQRYDRLPDEVETDCREIIDSDDDAESAAAKIAANVLRPNAERVMKPATLIVDADLEAFCWRIFEQLIANGADVRQIHPYSGQSLLHVAVAHNNVAVARRLLQLGLDASAVDTDGNVPMSYVRSAEMIALLPPADVLHVTAETQRTPLAEYLVASDYRVCDVEVVRRLVAAGADVNRRDEATGMTPLMMCSAPEVAAVLLEAGADVNAKDEHGGTVLQRYMYKEHEQLVRLLLRQPGVKVDRDDLEAGSLLLGLMRFIPWHELQISDDQEQLERMFASASNGLNALSLLQRERNANDLRCLQRLLEQPDLDLGAESAKWTTDPQRFKLERGAHISQRRDKAALDWSRCPEPFDVCEEIEFFAAAGFNVDYNVDDCFRETALQGYAGYAVDKWRQTRIVAHLVAVGANYRLMRMDDRRVLEGLVLECLYEWDEERGLTVPRWDERFGEDEAGNVDGDGE